MAISDPIDLLKNKIGFFNIKHNKKERERLDYKL
jgi:hypothetical protein